MSELTTEDIGKQVTVELKDGTKHHGTLVSVDTQQFSIQVAESPDPIVIPMAEIMSAHVKESNPMEVVLVNAWGGVAMALAIVFVLASTTLGPAFR